MGAASLGPVRAPVVTTPSKRRGGSQYCSRMMQMTVSRRSFLASGALATGAVLVPNPGLGQEPRTADGATSPVRLGLASYTFRNFSRAQLIGFMKDLDLTDLNCKDAKDHLPMDPAAEAQDRKSVV